jgi:hypothetical protein
MLHDVRDQDSRPQSHGNAGMAFNTVGGTGVPATNTQPNPRPDITCHKCGKVGHFAGKCAEAKHANGIVMVHTAAKQVPTDGVSVLGTDGAASMVPPAGDVVMALLGGDVDEPVYSFQFLQNGTID